MNMELIRVITDEDMWISGIPLNNPIIRYWARWIVFSDDGKIAMLYQNKYDEYKLPGWWVEQWESLEQAFKREILEEVGINVEDIKQLWIVEERIWIRNFRQISYVFEARKYWGFVWQKFTQDENDAWSEIVWVSLDDALKLMEQTYSKIQRYKDKAKFSFILRDLEIVKYYINFLS